MIPEIMVTSYLLIAFYKPLTTLYMFPEDYRMYQFLAAAFSCLSKSFVEHVPIFVSIVPLIYREASSACESFFNL